MNSFYVNKQEFSGTDKAKDVAFDQTIERNTMEESEVTTIKRFIRSSLQYRPVTRFIHN